VRAVAAAVVVLVGGSGCSPAQGDGVDLPLSAPSTGPTFASPSPTSTATPSGQDVPRTCEELVPTTDLLTVVAVPLQGEGSFVYAGPLPESGRTGRITCGYGAPRQPDGTVGEPAVEVTLNGYVDAGTARSRLDTTVAAARTQGQQIEAAELDGRAGFLFGDPAAVTYVGADGARTAVVTVRRGVVADSALRLVLLDLAALCLGLPTAAVPQ
jgi:hypothetical protein